MLFGVGALVVLVAVAIVRRISVRGINGGSLGTMSEQWLAQHRASPPL
jgi:hypothetical protein